jgi:hypothetical protein
VTLEPYGQEVIYDTGEAEWISHNPDVLRLKFSTSINLSDLYRSKSAGGAYVSISLCPYTRDPNIWFGRIYYRGKPVYSDAEESSDPKPYTYEAFIRYVSRWRDEVDKFGAHEGKQFPLPPMPQDLCFRIEAGGWPGFDSNVAVIPKDRLMRALHAEENGAVR